MTNAATTMTAIDPTPTVDTYLAMWNDTDPARRAGLIAKAWAPEGKYWDPMLQASGHEELSVIAAVAQEQFPNPASCAPPASMPTTSSSASAGRSSVRKDRRRHGSRCGHRQPGGKLTRIVGFFDEPPAK
jgi:hypothetical protein